MSWDIKRLAQDVRDFAEPLGVEALITWYPSPIVTTGAELTDLNANPTGQGNGTKVMEMLCKAADTMQIDIYVAPATERNRKFYRRFGFRRFNHSMMRRDYLEEGQEHT